MPAGAHFARDKTAVLGERQKVQPVYMNSVPYLAGWQFSTAVLFMKVLKNALVLNISENPSPFDAAVSF